MPGTAASESIFFSASVIMSIILVGIFTAAIYDFAQDLESRSDAMTEAMTGRIQIVSDEQAVPYRDAVSDSGNTRDTITLYIMNVGDSDVQAKYTNSQNTVKPYFLFILDGQVIPERDTYLTGGPDRNNDATPDTYFKPGDHITIDIRMTGIDTSIDHTLKVSSMMGQVSDSMIFRVVDA